MSIVHVLLLLIGQSFALYSADSAVIILNAENFESEVLNSEELWLVEFFASWCGHCQNLVPEYEKSARSLQGIIKIGAVDMTSDQSLGSKYDVSGFPTLKFFGANKSSPITYEEGRTAKEIVDFTLKQAQEIAMARIAPRPKPEKIEEPENDEDVIILGDNNFEDFVVGSDEIWLVEFFAEWCGHCKSLAPEWAKTATYLKGQVKVAKVDAEKATQTAAKYKIGGYPAIRLFRPGQEEPEIYDGPRESGSLSKYALQQLDAYGKPPVIVQITSEAVLQKYCSQEICIVSFLPHIYDSSASERNKYFEIIRKSLKNNRGKPLRYLWAQAGDFYKLEQVLGLGSGYPAAIGINLDKKKFAVMRAAFKLEEIDTFVKKIVSGNVGLSGYQEIPKLGNVKEWDGKDQKPEEIDL